jgi:hypothetical protein
MLYSANPQHPLNTNLTTTNQALPPTPLFIAIFSAAANIWLKPAIEEDLDTLTKLQSVIFNLFFYEFYIKTV